MKVDIEKIEEMPMSVPAPGFEREYKPSTIVTILVEDIVTRLQKIEAAIQDVGKRLNKLESRDNEVEPGE